MLSGRVPAGSRLDAEQLDPDHPGSPNLVTGNNNLAPATSPVIAQFCNGARVPPENCASQAGQVNQASCLGYNTPVGASETTGLTQVFAFNDIKPTATVDEGHNWLNLVYGPLTLNRPRRQPRRPRRWSPRPPPAPPPGPTRSRAGRRPSTPAPTPAPTVTWRSAACVRNALPLPSTVSTDFFGNPRALNATNKADIGAVERQ